MSTLDVLDPAFRGTSPIVGLVKPAPGEAQWPRQLKLSDDDEKRLVQYLYFELMRCIEEREQLVQDWVQWQRDYWAKPEQKEKNFPFKRACNVVIPLTAIAVEAVYARIINTLFSVEPFYSIRPIMKDWVDVAPKLSDWFQTEVHGPLNMWGFCRESLLELVKLGTCVGKSGYERTVKKSLQTRADGTEEDVFITTHNGGTLDHVPLANFLIRVIERDPQSAPWVGEEHISSWTQVKRESLSGRWKKDVVDKIKAYWTQRNIGISASGEYEHEKDVDAHTEPAWNQEFRWYEIWLSFDVDGDGVDEEIVVDFHRDSNTILSCRYNWYSDLHRPYRVGVYVPVEGRIYGIGIGKQNEQFQPLITTMHRQRVDNATLANMMQIAVKKTSGYGPGEPLFPGKMWFLDNPTQDIVGLKLSENYTSQITHEEYAQTLSEKRSGANEIILGSPHEGTPGTATSDVTRLAESNKRFDLVLRNIRAWLGQLGMDVLANQQQFGTRGLHWLVLGEDGQYVEEFLNLPPQLIRDGAIVEVTVTDSINNETVKQQQWMGLFSVLTQYYDKTMQTVAMLGDKQMFMAMGQAALEAGDYAMHQLLLTFREARVDVDKLMLASKFIQNMQEMMNAQSGQPQGTNVSGLIGSPQTPGMGGVPTANGSGGQPAPFTINGMPGAFPGMGR